MDPLAPVLKYTFKYLKAAPVLQKKKISKDSFFCKKVLHIFIYMEEGTQCLRKMSSGTKIQVCTIAVYLDYVFEL